MTNVGFRHHTPANLIRSCRIRKECATVERPDVRSSARAAFPLAKRAIDFYSRPFPLPETRPEVLAADFSPRDNLTNARKKMRYRGPRWAPRHERHSPKRPRRIQNSR